MTKVSEWQPIETAPEGVDIRVSATNTLEPGKWETVLWVDRKVGGGFSGPHVPSKWQPLPTPPGEK